MYSFKPVIFILSFCLFLSLGIAAPLKESYLMRVTGISSAENGVPQIYIVLESGEKVYSLEKLRPGDCYRNLCFDRISENKKNIVIAYKFQNVWQRKLISVNSLNSPVLIEMDSMGEYKNIIESTLSLWHQFFPEALMLDITDDPRRPFLFKNGKLIAKPFIELTDEALEKQIKDAVSLVDILSYLASYYNLKHEDGGVLTLGPPVDDCTQFRAKLLSHFKSADELRALQYRLLVLCKLEDRVGYCDSDVISMFNGKSECREKDTTGYEFNACGGLVDGKKESKISSIFYDNNWLNAKMLAKEGKVCAVESQAVEIEVRQTKDASKMVENSQGFTVQAKGDFKKNGVCVQGQCVSSETNSCREGISNTVKLFFEEHEFLSLFGISFVDLEEGNLKETGEEMSKVIQFVSIKSNRDRYSRFNNDTLRSSKSQLPNGTSCPGGLCQNGECISFEDLLKVESGSDYSCQNLENGNPCSFQTARSNQQGVCFQAKCYLCDSKSREKLVGLECPGNSLYPDQMGYRRSCKTPDICSYK